MLRLSEGRVATRCGGLGAAWDWGDAGRVAWRDATRCGVGRSGAVIM